VTTLKIRSMPGTQWRLAPLQTDQLGIACTRQAPHPLWKNPQRIEHTLTLADHNLRRGQRFEAQVRTEWPANGDVQ